MKKVMYTIGGFGVKSGETVIFGEDRVQVLVTIEVEKDPDDPRNQAKWKRRVLMSSADPRIEIEETTSICRAQYRGTDDKLNRITAGICPNDATKIMVEQRDRILIANAKTPHMLNLDTHTRTPPPPPAHMQPSKPVVVVVAQTPRRKVVGQKV